MRLDKILVCFKRTLYERYRRKKDFKEVLQTLGRDDPRLEKVFLSHSETIRARRSVVNILKKLGISHEILFKPQVVDERDFSLALIVGGDGTMLDYARFFKRLPVLGVNSSPSVSVGRFYLGGVERLEALLEAVRSDTLVPTELLRLKVTVDGEVYPWPALNEVLFAHEIPAVTSRYVLSIRGVQEEQKSSGVWVATAAGSSGALHSAGGQVLSASSRKVLFVVREPFVWPPGNKTLKITGGEVPEDGITFISKMFRGAVFLDGARGMLRAGYLKTVRVTLDGPTLPVYLREL